MFGLPSKESEKSITKGYSSRRDPPSACSPIGFHHTPNRLSESAHASELLELNPPTLSRKGGGKRRRRPYSGGWMGYRHVPQRN